MIGWGRALRRYARRGGGEARPLVLAARSRCGYSALAIEKEMTGAERVPWAEIRRVLSGARYDQREFLLGDRTVHFARLHTFLCREMEDEDLVEEQREAFRTLLGQAIHGTPRASFSRLEPDAWRALDAVFSPPLPEDLAADRSLLKAVSFPSEPWVIFALLRPRRWRVLRAQAGALAGGLAPQHAAGNPLASYAPEGDGAPGDVHCHRCCGSIEGMQNSFDFAKYERLASTLRISIDRIPVSCRGCPGICEVIDDPNIGVGFQNPFVHITCTLCGGSDDSGSAMSILDDAEFILEPMREANRDRHDGKE